jgi:hypothetical protein
MRNPSRVSVKIKYQRKQVSKIEDAAFSGSLRIVQELLERWDSLPDIADKNGDLGTIEFVLQPIEHITWRTRKTFEIRRTDAKSLRLRIKPGDNGSAWEYDLRPPNWMDPDRVRIALLTETLEGEVVPGELPLLPISSARPESAKPSTSADFPTIVSFAAEQGDDISEKGLDLFSKMNAASQRAAEYSRQRTRLETESKQVLQDLRAAQLRLQEAQKSLEAIEGEKKAVEEALLNLMVKQELDVEVSQFAAMAKLFRSFEGV